MIDYDELKEGDPVEWIHYSHRGNISNMTRYSGYVVQKCGDIVICKRGKNGKKLHHVPVERLSAPGGDPLRSLVSAVAAGYKEKEKGDQ